MSAPAEFKRKRNEPSPRPSVQFCRSGVSKPERQAGIDQHAELVAKVRRDLATGLKKPHTGRHGLTAQQTLRSLTLMRVKNWDYRELRERIVLFRI